MIDALIQAMQVIVEYFLDGFLALIAISLTAPLLGVILVLRRMPLLGLAIPPMAGCGLAATFFFFALVAADTSGELEEPGRMLQLAGSLIGVAVGLLALAVLNRDRRFLGVQAGVVFLLAVALREIFFLESPYERIFEESIQHGRLLTVGPTGRNQVLLCCVLATAIALKFWRRLWVCAFDADQATLLGLSGRRYLGVTLFLLGAFCAVCVPVVGPEVVLMLLLIPPAILRPVTPSLAAYAPLSMAAGSIGSVAAFVIACTEGIDWPPGPAMALSLVVTSLVLALLCRCGSRLGAMLRFDRLRDRRRRLV